MEPARKRGRSDMWEHFNLIAPDKVRCLVCSAELKYHGNTSSMIRHFTAKHGAAMNQGNTNQVDRKQELDEALVNMVVKDSQPFSIMDDCGFKEFVALLDPTYTLPSRQGLKNMAKQFLCTPASSVPCERVFSKCGEIFSKKRNRLSQKTVEKIMYLNKNI
ncbi:hypothetical protein PAMA_013265 [Pampus argenteus]